MRLSKSTPPADPVVTFLEAEFEQWRHRYERDCELQHTQPQEPETLSAYVRSYFGEPMEPPPLLVMNRSDFTRYVLRRSRGLPEMRAVQEQVALLWTNVDEEFETDHGDARRLRSIGLKRGLFGRPVFYADVS